MNNQKFARELIERFDGWVEDLTVPLRPLHAVPDGNDGLRLVFRVHGPHTAMVGELIRAVSGIHAALHLADVGYLAECAALLRIVQRARTPDEYDVSERIRYVSREELMKADLRMAEGTNIDGERTRALHRFLNMMGDAYVHGAYETTMELCNPRTARFEMCGHPEAAKREEFIEAVFLKSHEVVVSVELAALVIGRRETFEAARDAAARWTLWSLGRSRRRRFQDSVVSGIL